MDQVLARSSSAPARERQVSWHRPVAQEHPGQDRRDRRSRAASQRHLASDLPSQGEERARDGRDRPPTRPLLQTRVRVSQPPRTSTPVTMLPLGSRASGSSILAPGLPMLSWVRARRKQNRGACQATSPARAGPSHLSEARLPGTARPTPEKPAESSRPATGLERDESDGLCQWQAGHQEVTLTALRQEHPWP